MLSKDTREAIKQRLAAAQVRERLEQMEKDPALQTRVSSYSANSELYPDNQIPFIEKHIAYLINHPKVDCDQYLSNLRLMLKVRS